MELFGQRSEMMAGSGALHHWAEYFVVVGTDANEAKLFTDSTKEGINKLTLLTNLFSNLILFQSHNLKGTSPQGSQKRVPVVLTRIPVNDVPGYPLPDQVPMVRRATKLASHDKLI